MLTSDEILKALLIPAGVSLLLGALAWWRGWNWLFPLAVGGAFVFGYWLMRAPAWNPKDGSERLYWLAMPVTGLAMTYRWTRGWVAVLAGIGVYFLLQPLYPRHVSPVQIWMIPVTIGAVGAVQLVLTRVAEARLPSSWIIAAWAMVLGGAGVLVMSSNYRVMGVHGMMAAAATGPVVLFAWRVRVGSAVLPVVFSLLAGVLITGRFYPEPGITWTQLIVLLGVPAVIGVGAVLPLKRVWLRGLIVIAMVGMVVALVVGPVALKAKKEAESPDPYGEYYR